MLRNRNRRRPVRTVLGTAVLGLLILSLSACDAPTLHTRLRTYANDNSLLTDWTGGDGGASVQLPDGRIFWAMNDSYLGTVNANGSRPGGQPFVHNTLVQQNPENGNFGPTHLTPQSGQPFDDWLQSPDPTSHYWILDMIVEGNNLRVLVVEVLPGGVVKNFVITLAIPALPAVQYVGSRVELPINSGPPGSPGGAWALVYQSPSYTYIYAVGGLANHVARVPTGSFHIASSWRYLTTADQWVTSANAPQGSLKSISPMWQGSVVRVGPGDYVMAGFSDILVGDLVIAHGSTPYGPFEPPQVVFSDPQVNTQCDAGTLGAYAFLPHEEHWTEDLSATPWSYSVNCFGGGWAAIEANVERYRPRFVEIDLTSPSGAAMAPLEPEPGGASNGASTPSPALAEACAVGQPGMWQALSPCPEE